MSDFGGAVKPLSENPDYKIAILGVPFDEKSSYLRGAAESTWKRTRSWSTSATSTPPAIRTNHSP